MKKTYWNGACLLVGHCMYALQVSLETRTITHCVCVCMRVIMTTMVHTQYNTNLKQYGRKRQTLIAYSQLHKNVAAVETGCVSVDRIMGESKRPALCLTPFQPYHPSIGWLAGSGLQTRRLLPDTYTPHATECKISKNSCIIRISFICLLFK